MARQSRTKYAVLGMLSLGPKCGYEIKKELERSSMFFWNESYGQIYPMLKKLVAAQLATLEIVERDDQPDMKVYTITEDGRAELATWLELPAEPHPVRNEMLLKLFFGAVSTDKTCLAHVGRFQKELRQQAVDLAAQKEDYEQQGMDRSEMVYLMLTLKYGEVINDALTQWCQEAHDILQDLPNREGSASIS